MTVKTRWILGGAAVALLLGGGAAALRARRRPSALGLPREPSLDSSLALLREGHTFIPRRCEALGTDVFETRLMLRRVICARGEEAARMFYAPGRFTRRRSMPPTTLRLLQDVGSVALLDGEAHHARKTLFMSLVTPERVRSLAERMEHEWRASLPRWERMDAVVLHEEVQEILCRAVCDWAGIPLPEASVRERTRELGAMIEGAGSVVGLQAIRGLLLRRRTERWARNLIQGIRAGVVPAPAGSPAFAIAFYSEPDGRQLPARVAAVELINLLRPTVAVARFIVFAAMAMHQYPACARRLAIRDEGYLLRFVQEVRRFYPFFPAVGGRALEAFEWRGIHFPKDTWVLFDLHGTDHDPRTWANPDTFDPDRFAMHTPNAFDLVPQGGGEHFTGHRCPGETITVELVKEAVRLLTTAMRYVVPEQDLRIVPGQLPPIPLSRFVIRGVNHSFVPSVVPELRAGA